MQWWCGDDQKPQSACSTSKVQLTVILACDVIIALSLLDKDEGFSTALGLVKSSSVQVRVGSMTSSLSILLRLVLALSAQQLLPSMLSNMLGDRPLSELAPHRYCEVMQ